MKKKLALLTLAVVVLWSIWYAWPRPFLKMTPEPANIEVAIRRFGETAEESSWRTFNVAVDSPEGAALTNAMADLRVCRSPLDPLRQLLQSTATGRKTAPGDYNFIIHIFAAEGGWTAVQFFLDDWEYGTSRQSRYLSCLVSGGEATGRELGDFLWDMSYKIDSVL